MIGIPEHEKLPQLMKLSGHHIFFSFVPFSHSLNTRVLFGIVLGGIIIKPQYYIFSKFQQLSYISLKNLNLKIINNYEVRVIFRHISISQSVSSSLSVSLSLCPSLSFSVLLCLSLSQEFFLLFVLPLFRLNGCRLWLLKTHTREDMLLNMLCFLFIINF